MKKAILVFSLALAATSAARGAQAQAQYLCCDGLQAPCVSQATPCSFTQPYTAQLSDLPPDAGAHWPDEGPNVFDASFPAGVNGYLLWTTATPRLGVCPVLSPSAEPVGCFQVSLDRGVGAEIEVVSFPASSQWDSWARCYGGSDGGCQNLSDLQDPAVMPTPSGSCCAPPLREGLQGSQWTVDFGQALPGVPEPYGDLSACETPGCDAPPDAGASPMMSAASAQDAATPSMQSPSCQPTTCELAGATCSTIPDGCGGTLACASHCPTSTCSVRAVGPGGDAVGWAAGLVPLLGIAVGRKWRAGARNPKGPRQPG